MEKIINIIDICLRYIAGITLYLILISISTYMFEHKIINLSPKLGIWGTYFYYAGCSILSYFLSLNIILNKKK